MRTVAITPDAIEALATALPVGQPVTMLNLLRFRDEAQYAAGEDDAPCSGREAYYARYAPVATPMVVARGGARSSGPGGWRDIPCARTMNAGTMC